MNEQNVQLMLSELQLLKEGIKQLAPRKTKLNDTRMLKKHQVLDRLGVSPTNPIKNEIFKSLPTYENKFSKQAIFKEEDVLELIHSFPVVYQGNPTTTA